MAVQALDRLYGEVKASARSNPALIADALTQAILQGALPGGAPLRQSELARKFGVSQTPVREALKIVCDTGLARAKPNCGVAVRELDAGEAREITDLRVLLECDALARAIPNYSRADYDSLAAINRKLSRARKIDVIVDLNTQFHRALYAPSGRTTTLAIIDTLRIRFERYLRFVWRTSDHVDLSSDQHAEIVELAASNCVEAACDLLESHIRTTGRVIAERLSAGNS